MLWQALTWSYTRAACCPYSSCSCCCYYCHMRSLLFMVIIYFGQPSPQHLCRLFISAINIKCYDNDAVPIPIPVAFVVAVCFALHSSGERERGEGERGERALIVVSTHIFNFFLAVCKEQSNRCSHCYFTYVIINILLVSIYLKEWAISMGSTLILNFFRTAQFGRR